MLLAVAQIATLASEARLETAAVQLDGADRLLRIVEQDVSPHLVIAEAILVPALCRFDRARLLDLPLYDLAALPGHLRRLLPLLLLFLPCSV